MDDRIVLVCELVVRMNKSEYPKIEELKKAVIEDVPVLSKVEISVDVSA